MTAIDRGIEFSNWSDDLRSALRRRICESGGVALIVLAAIMAVALDSTISGWLRPMQTGLCFGTELTEESTLTGHGQ